ncbi:MAG: sigma-54 dependent DNA-binding response regulator [Planctomycetota bacterium]|jgi:two-component system NtrC family response regulator
MTLQRHPLVHSLLRQPDAEGMALVWRTGAQAGSPVCHLFERLGPDGIDDVACAAATAAEPEPDLVRLARVLWAHRLYLRDRLDEALRLADLIAPPHDGDGTWIAAVRWLHGLVAYRRGRLGQASTDLRIAWDAAPEHTWLRQRIGEALTLALRLRERGAEAVAIAAQLARRSGPDRSPPGVPELADAAGCGRIAEAQALCERLGGTLSHPDEAGTYAFHRVLTDLMAETMPDGGDPPRRGTDADRAWLRAAAGIDIAEYLTTTRCLLRGDTAGALAAAEDYLAALGASGREVIRFDLYDLVRARLAVREPAAAAAELAALQAARGEHHWDAWFQARIDRLRGDTAAADRRFATVLAEATALDAVGRLRFEILLAIELPVPVAGRWLLATIAAAAAPVAAPAAAGRLIGPSPALADIRRLIARFAPLDLPVLITGETGTGKELAARALHEAGPRRERPFLAVNCSAISGTLLAAELFGCARGAFTGAVERDGLFAAAADGTLLLDEIGEIPAELQAALLRVLENGDYLRVGSATPQRTRCRILAATNRDLDRAVQEGRFRADLAHRLRHLRLHLPPLRARRDDILPLAQHFLALGGGQPPRIAPELAAALAARPWPGNARELRNTLDLIRVMADGRPRLELADLEAVEPADGPDVPAPTSAVPAGPEPGAGERRRTWAAELRRHLRSEGRITAREAARLLGVSRPTATRLLRACCAEGVAVKMMPTRSPATHWFRWTGPSPQAGDQSRPSTLAET